MTFVQNQIHGYTSYVLGAFTKHAALCVDIDIHNITATLVVILLNKTSSWSLGNQARSAPG